MAALPDLVASNDEDIAPFEAGDQNYFLRAAGDAVRRYCGWHIYPNLAFDDVLLNIGRDGLIGLRSRHVTDVY